jgi:hypothetical protein
LPRVVAGFPSRHLLHQIRVEPIGNPTLRFPFTRVPQRLNAENLTTVALHALRDGVVSLSGVTGPSS